MVQLEEASVKPDTAGAQEVVSNPAIAVDPAQGEWLSAGLQPAEGVGVRAIQDRMDGAAFAADIFAVAVEDSQGEWLSAGGASKDAGVHVIQDRQDAFVAAATAGAEVYAAMNDAPRVEPAADGLLQRDEESMLGSIDDAIRSFRAAIARGVKDPDEQGPLAREEPVLQSTTEATLSNRAAIARGIRDSDERGSLNREKPAMGSTAKAVQSLRATKARGVE